MRVGYRLPRVENILITWLAHTKTAIACCPESAQSVGSPNSPQQHQSIFAAEFALAS